MIKYRLKEAEAGAEKVLPLGLVGDNRRGGNTGNVFPLHAGSIFIVGSPGAAWRFQEHRASVCILSVPH